MKNLSSFLLFVISLNLYGQNSTLDSIAIHQLYFIQTEDEAVKLAAFDIRNAGPFLLLQSGETMIYFSSDSLIEAKFNFSYYDFGCLSPSQHLVEAYSRTTFDHMDIKFGKAWRKEVRKDVLFLKRKY